MILHDKYPPAYIIQTETNIIITPTGTISGEGVKQRKGAFSSALDNRGYGWLLEVEEDDEELKPLLLV